MNVVILLSTGPHYLVASRGGTTRSYYSNNKYYVADNLNYRLTIKPETDGDTVTIYNKRREKFRVEVPYSLSMERIVIDGLDSILYSRNSGEAEPACLSEERPCCAMSSDGLTVENSSDVRDSDAFTCSASFAILMASMETDCFANWPRSMFKMRSTKYEDLHSTLDFDYDATQVGIGQITNELTLTEVTI